MSDLLYVPSRWGQEFHDLTVDEALGAGAAGPGKSIVLLHEADRQIIGEHQRCLDPLHPHQLKWGQSVGHALHLRRTKTMLGTSIKRAKIFFPSLDPKVKWNEGNLTFTFQSGYQYQFGHCKDPDDWWIYHGGEYTILLFDELCQFLEEQYEQIGSRLRTNDPVLKDMLKTRSMANPTMENETGEDFVVNDPFWVRRRFVDPAPEGRQVLYKELTRANGEKVEYTYIYLPAKLYDNPDPAFVRDYELKLLSRPKHIREALIEGNWYYVAGAFFAESWNPKIHICDPFPIPPTWPMARSMDWGYRSPGIVHWWARSDEDVWYCVRELRFKLKTADQVAARIKNIEEKMGLWKGKRSTLNGPADTQIWEQRGGIGKAMVQTFREHGVQWTKALKTGGGLDNKWNRAQNARRFMEMLNDHNGGTTSPGIVFFKSCRSAVSTIPAILPDPTDRDAPMKGGDDHALDCLAEWTQVTVPNGYRELSSLRPGDLVLSTDGRFHPCTGGRFVRRSEVFAVTIETQANKAPRRLTATGSHLILAECGTWKRVDQLVAGDYVFSPWIPLCTQEHVKNLTELVTTCADVTSGELLRSSKGADSSIESCGRGIWGRFLRGIMSTIGTKTRQTTALQTWKQSRQQATLATTPRGNLRKAASWVRKRLGLGTRAKRGWPGTENTERERSGVLGGELSVGVNSAGRASSTRARLDGSGAVGPVPRHTGERLEWTTKSEYALPAGADLWLPGMTVRKPAHGRAVRIIAIEPAGVSDTWCTTVHGMGAFVAEGVVVSNSTLYFCAWASKNKGKARGKAPQMDDDDDDGPRRKSRGQLGYGL